MRAMLKCGIYFGKCVVFVYLKCPQDIVGMLMGMKGGNVYFLVGKRKTKRA